jgi:hypothetical protein
MGRADGSESADCLCDYGFTSSVRKCMYTGCVSEVTAWVEVCQPAAQRHLGRRRRVCLDPRCLPHLGRYYRWRARPRRRRRRRRCRRPLKGHIGCRVVHVSGSFITVAQLEHLLRVL